MDDKNYTPEKNLANAPDDVSFDILIIIIKQIEKSICKIRCKDGGNGTGFFCIIPFPDKFHQIPVLMTNNHVISEDDLEKNNKIKFTINNDKLSFEITIDDFRKIYTFSKYLMIVRMIYIEENQYI